MKRAGVLAMVVTCFACGTEAKPVPPLPSPPAARAETSATTANDAAVTPSAAASGLPPLPAADEAILERIGAQIDEVEKMDATNRRHQLAGFLETLGTGRLSPKLVDALALYGSAHSDRAMVRSYLYRVVRTDPAALAGWLAACDTGAVGIDGSAVLDSISANETDERRKVLRFFRECRLKRHGLIEAEELRANSGALILVHTIWAYLQAGGEAHPLERRVVTGLLRVDESFSTPITEEELAGEPTLKGSKPLQGDELAAFRRQVDRAIALLEKNDAEALMQEVMVPADYDASDVEAFRTSERAQKLLPLLKRARAVPPALSPTGEVELVVHPTPDDATAGEVSWKKVKGTWRLRSFMPR